MSIKAPERISNRSKLLDALLEELGLEGLAIELHLRGLSGIIGEPPVQPCTMETALWEFQEHLRFSGTALSSRKTYLSELAQFSSFVQSQQLYCADVQQALTNRLLGDYLNAGKYKSTTRNKKANLLRKFIRYCQRNKWFTGDMPSILKTESVERSIPKALSTAAVNELLELSKTTKMAHRFYCFVTTMLATGARIGEVASMTIGNIDFNAYKATVVGKNHPEGRTVFLGQEITALLKDYICFRYNPNSADDPNYNPSEDPALENMYVFSANDGTTPPDISSLQHTFRRVVEQMTTVCFSQVESAVNRGQFVHSTANINPRILRRRYVGQCVA